MKKRRYSDQLKEQAIALYSSGESLSGTAKKFKVPIGTLSGWINQKPAEEIEKVRNENKAKFAEKAWEPINNAMELLNREIKTALDKQEELERLIDSVLDLEDEDMPYKEKLAAIKQLSKIGRMDLRELTTAIGTLYDKQALAKGDTTENITITLEGDLKDYAE